jgi:hypothetical protein
VINVVRSSLSGFMRNLLNAAIISSLVRYLDPYILARTLSIRGIGYLSLLVRAFNFR